jgi:retron-type reverse transcriptase
VRLDVRDFFTSTSAVRVVGYFRRIGWDAEAAALLGRLCTHEGGLPQGAPTSPRLANLVNYGLDARLSRFAQRNGLAYTRYADDMTFSLGDEATKLSAGVGEIVHRVGFELHRLGYRLNTRKTRVYRRHNRQVVAGLVVNDRVNLPRKTRRKLRAVAHHIETGRPATMTPEQLRGWYALEMMVLRQSIEPGDER